MARSKKVTRRTGTRDVVSGTLAAPWRRNRTVVRLTRAIVALDQKTATTVVEAVLELGRMLLRVKDELPHGEWAKWLSEGVRLEQNTAARYMAVSAWAMARPREFAKFRALSISKIYRLLALEPEQRRALHGRALAVPGTDRRLMISEMTLAQFDRVIRDLTAPPPPADPVPKLLQGARHRFGALQAYAAELIEHGADVDPEQVADLHAGLVELAERLESAFGL